MLMKNNGGCGSNIHMYKYINTPTSLINHFYLIIKPTTYVTERVIKSLEFYMI